jgi:sulfur relay (sulfurtransferase) DsrC/TusE family protein
MGLVDVAGNSKEELLEDEKQEYEYWQARVDGEERPFQESFSLTELGEEFVKTRLATRLTSEHWKVIDKFKKRCTSAPLKALLKYVYTRYPEMTKKSSIRDEVLGR